MNTYKERPSNDRHPFPPRVDPKDPNAILQPRPGGPAERLGTRLGRRRPVFAGFIVDFSGYLIIAAIMIALGVLITKAPQLSFIRRWDEVANEWFVTWRTSAIDAITRI